MRVHLAASVVSALSVLCISCSGQSPWSKSNAPPPRGPAPAAIWPAPDFSLEDPDGNKVNRSQYAGKIVVLEWVNPDCDFTQRLAKAGTVKALAEKYRAKGVVWLAIDSNTAMTRQDNQNWVQKNGLPYPVLDDHRGRAARLFGVKYTPEFVIIDANEFIAYQGALDDNPACDAAVPSVNYVQQALDDLLAGRRVALPQVASYGSEVRYTTDYTPVASYPPLGQPSPKTATTLQPSAKPGK